MLLQAVPNVLEGYMPIGDITVIGLCLLMAALLSQMHIFKDKSFRLLLMMLVSCAAASVSNVMLFGIRMQESCPVMLIYGLRLIHYTMLTLSMVLYIRYLLKAMWVRTYVRKRFGLAVLLLLIAGIAVDVAGTVFRFGFYIAPDGHIEDRPSLFLIPNILFMALMLWLLIRYRKRLIRQIFWSLIGTDLICVAIVAIQEYFGQTSYTGVAHFLPFLSILYLFHSNPFDINTGAISESFFYDELDEERSDKHTLILMSCIMMNFSKALQQSKDLSDVFRDFFRVHMRQATLYRFTNDRFILCFPKSYDVQQDREMEDMLEEFKEHYKRFALDYKIVIMETNPEVVSGADYLRLIEFAEQTMPFNVIYRVGETDIRRFYSNSYILSQLEDIVQRHDLDDERVLVYCQPVFNISTNKYDTAEALMRLRLEKTGMIYPDQFIPLAEQHGLIHMMSLIILNKTCGAIRTMMEDGYDISRISVNFSTLDIRYEGFCQEVQQIIDRNQIPYSKIAIEITESRSEYDFNIMKGKVMELQQLGIKFYLDDFGTGYSNFERIMEIPFDIIKFDRSLLIESRRSDSSRYMVSTFASMFNQLKYSILFEGVENENDEESCVSMSAKYLQGYKYSKPIPIEELHTFLEVKV